MKAGRPSATAYRVALRRAAHQVIDDPKVLDDPIALPILGPRGAERIRTERRSLDSPFSRALRAFLAARSRFAEEQLALSIRRGVRQYVVLGAGLDTFAYRNPFPASELRVFEVDHPDTQAWKRGLLAEAGLAAPEGLTFVPVNFESQSVWERLRESGFRDDVPTFFSWLGVTMYLSRDVVMGTFAHVATRLPKGSAIVFDYAITPSSLPWIHRLIHHAVARRVASIGEPWTTTFVPRALVAEMSALGFAEVEDLGEREINARWFDQRSDRLRVRSLAHLMRAQA